MRRRPLSLFERVVFGVETISVIVLAGGASQRMGTNKALLPVSQQETLVDRVVANLRALSEDVVLVSNSPELYSSLPVRPASAICQCGLPLKSAGVVC